MIAERLPSFEKHAVRPARLESLRNRTPSHLHAHIKVLEREIERLSALLADRDATVATMNEIGARMEGCMKELASMSGQFQLVRQSVMALSRCEGRVYEFVKRNPGMPMKQVADALGLCISTVKYHMTNIYAKAGVGGRNEL